MSWCRECESRLKWIVSVRRSVRHVRVRAQSEHGERHSERMGEAALDGDETALRREKSSPGTLTVRC